MSFSSTSSKESSSVNNGNTINGNVLHSSLSEPGKPIKIIQNLEKKIFFPALSVTTPIPDKTHESNSTPINGKRTSFDRNHNPCFELFR